MTFDYKLTEVSYKDIFTNMLGKLSGVLPLDSLNMIGKLSGVVPLDSNSNHQLRDSRYRRHRRVFPLASLMIAQMLLAHS